MTDSDFIISY